MQKGMMYNPASEKDIRHFTIQELVQIIINEDKAKRYLAYYSVTFSPQTAKFEKNLEKIAIAVKQNGFEYFIDRIIEKNLFLSEPLRTEIKNYLFNQITISDSLRKKAFL